MIYDSSVINLAFPNQSPLKRLGRIKNRNLRCSLEVFPELVPTTLVIRPMPTITYSSFHTHVQTRAAGIVDIAKLHESVDEVHKEVSIRNERVLTRAQELHVAQTNVLPLNVMVGYFLKVKVSGNRGYKLQTKWKGPMRVVEAMSHLLFVVEDINISHRIITHAQRLIPYPTSQRHRQASRELQQQAVYYDKMTRVVEEIIRVRKVRNRYEVFVGWLGHERDNDTWKPLRSILEDIPGVVEDYLHTAGQRNIKQEILDFYF